MTGTFLPSRPKTNTKAASSPGSTSLFPAQHIFEQPALPSSSVFAPKIFGEATQEIPAVKATILPSSKTFAPRIFGQASQEPLTENKFMFILQTPSQPTTSKQPRPTSSPGSPANPMSADNEKPRPVAPLSRPKKPSSRPAPAIMKSAPEKGEDELTRAHLALLQTGTTLQEKQEVTGTPLFTPAVQKHNPHLFTQYGFFAGLSDVLHQNSLPDSSGLNQSVKPDPRLFFNIAAPTSAFICGSQGSGKSHTLSCLLENCLMRSVVSQLENPLAGLVFHYDTFTSDLRGTPCEAAYLASYPGIKVRILCSPTNIRTIRNTYQGLNVTIEPLQINQSDLSTNRMMELMAVNQEDCQLPLYLHAIKRILREMRIEQQDTNGSFKYAKFKETVMNYPMSQGQQGPLNQRLDTLESFMPKSQTDLKANGKKKTTVKGTGWTITPGSLTIVDLSCPCVTAEAACSLFNICLSLFNEQPTTTGRVVALDEAHKYMNSSTDATNLTNTLLSSIRLQRHLGTRVFISTQEPTISPSLLDLCSLTIVHRFSSPEWLRCLRSHLAALSFEESEGRKSVLPIFNEIVKLRVGEALLFCPSAIIDTEAEASPESEKELKKLGTGYLKIKIRARITEDGGKSVMAD